MGHIKNIFKGRDVISLEDRYNDIAVKGAISSESVAGFFTEFRARATDLGKTILPSTAERPYREAIRHQSIASAKLAEMDNTDLAEINIIIPESFTGNMNVLVEDVILAYDSISRDLLELVFALRKDTALNINTSNEGYINPPSSFIKSKHLTKKRETFRAKFAGMFKTMKSVSHGRILDHFRSTTDVREVFYNVRSLESTLSKNTIDDLNKAVSTLIEEVNTYVEILDGVEVDKKCDRNLREYTTSILEAAKSFEMIGYLQAVSLQVYKSVEDIGNKINAYNKA